MWPLRRNVQYNKRYFFKDIFFFVLFLHIFLLGILFVYDTSKFHQQKFVINTDHLQSTIVFMPLHKRVLQKKSSSTQTLEQTQNRHVMSYDEYQKKIAEQQSKEIKPVVKHMQEKIIAPKVKDLSAPKVKSAMVGSAKTSLRIIKTELSKKVTLANKKSVEKKIAIKQAVSKNTVAQEKIEVKKKTEQKIVADKKNEKNSIVPQPLIEKEEPKKNDKIKIEPTISPQKIDAVTEKVIQQKLDTHDLSVDPLQGRDPEFVEVDLENISFIGSLDLEMMQIKEQIQNQIAQYYKPPVGMSKKTVCEFSIVVGFDGKAHRVVIKKSSGSIAHDICARAALLKVIFPKEVIRKEIIIELGQS